MKRYILYILLCLFLGVVTTVGVAWGLAYWYFRNFDTPGEVVRIRWHNGVATEQVIVQRRIGKTTVYYGARQETPEEFAARWNPDARFYQNTATLPGWSRLKDSHQNHTAVYKSAPDREVAIGVPFHSMQYQMLVKSRQRFRDPATTMKDNAEYINGIGFKQVGPPGRYVFGAGPLQPILLGFLMDALFYGVIWFGLIFGIGATRRAIRRKRGRCIKCGYDLRGNSGGDSGCSECGWGREV